MTNSPQIDSRGRQRVTREIFERLLESLSADAEEAARLYTRLHIKLAGLFSLKGLSDPAEAADETLDRAAVNIAAGANVPNVEKYCLGIARNVAREKLRLARREGSTFLSFVKDLPGLGPEQVERIYLILQPCFEKLAEADRELLTRYCQVMRGRARAEHRRQLAESLNISTVALRMRVTRLRDNLTDCAQKLSKQS